MLSLANELTGAAELLVPLIFMVVVLIVVSCLERL